MVIPFDTEEAKSRQGLILHFTQIRGRHSRTLLSRSGHLEVKYAWLHLLLSQEPNSSKGEAVKQGLKMSAFSFLMFGSTMWAALCHALHSTLVTQPASHVLCLNAFSGTKGIQGKEMLA